MIYNSFILNNIIKKQRKKLAVILLCIFSIYFIIGFFNIVQASDVYVWSNNAESIDDSVQTSASVSDGNHLNLESGSAILIEQSSGKILYEHNIHEQLRPASVTKVMTILLIMEQLEKGNLTLDTSISCSSTAASMGGSQIWLDPTEELTVHEMLKAICVASANDCTVAMAEYIAGSTDKFVEMMNNKAKELGMNDTCFKNCHGLDEDGHITSCYDISLMSRELLTKYPQITNYTTIWMDSLRNGQSELVNTNKLIRTYSGATGLKTGSTGLALYNLSASATRNNLSLIAVIMKAPSTKIRFAEAKKLLDYGFANYSCTNFGNKNDIIKSVNILKGTQSSLDCALEKDINIITTKNNDSNITQKIDIPDVISAPVKQNDIIGTITFYNNDELLDTVNLVAKNSVDQISFSTMFKRLLYNCFTLFRFN